MSFITLRRAIVVLVLSYSFVLQAQAQVKSCKELLSLNLSQPNTDLKTQRALEKLTSDLRSYSRPLGALASNDNLLESYITFGIYNQLGFKFNNEGAPQIKSDLISSVESLLSDDEKNSTAIKSIGALDEEIASVVEKVLGLIDPVLQEPLTLRQRLSQVLNLPKKFKQIRELVEREYSFAKLDENLFAHYGFHQWPDERHYQARSWTPFKPQDISPENVLTVDPVELVEYMRVAMEIEDPIEDYSRQSGASLRFILPNFARFMGSPQERYDYLDANGITRVCESAWCQEERRHGNAFSQAITMLTGERPDRDNPNEVAEVEEAVEAAFQHAMSRMTTELNASSTYLVFSTYANGALNSSIINMMRDEIKHLTIVSGAVIYLRGPQFLKMLGEISQIAKEFLTYNVENRTTGSGMTSNKITSIEFIYAHLVVMRQLRRYLASLPLSALRKIYDSESNIDAYDAVLASDEALANYASWEKDAEEKRRSLFWWRRQGRVHELNAEAIANSKSKEITLIIENEFDGFKGAEFYSSEKAAEIRAKINRINVFSLSYVDLKVGDKAVWRKILQDALRFYQISNNWFVQDIDSNEFHSNPEKYLNIPYLGE